MMDTRIIAVTHKEYYMPAYPGYINLMAGSALRPTISDYYVRDDTGDNISALNKEYCELTGLYWAWKNLNFTNIGICHYRRYFSSPADRKRVLSAVEAEELLKRNDFILPSSRNYIIESNYSQYVHAHHTADLDLVRDIIKEKHPEYITYYDRRMKMSKGHRFNMLITRKPLLDEYCEWLFDILFELEKRLDTSGFDERDRRVFGFAAERLLDVWIDAEGCRCMELPVIFVEKENLPYKAVGLIMRKVKSHIRGKKGVWTE